MQKSTAKDALTLGAVTGLSLAMLIGSRIISLSLDLRPGAPAQLTVASLERLTGVVLGLLGALILAWLVLGLVLALVAAFRHRAGHATGLGALSSLTPGFLARLAAAAVGSSILLATSANAAPMAGPASGNEQPAWAQAVDGEARPASAANESELLSPGWIPRPVPLPMQRVLGGDTRATEEVVVAPGDTLWSIAARHLDPHATATQIAEAWPRWYAANRELIGEDPDRLSVGLVLETPQSGAGESGPSQPQQHPSSRSTP